MDVCLRQGRGGAYQRYVDVQVALYSLAQRDSWCKAISSSCSTRGGRKPSFFIPFLSIDEPAPVMKNSRKCERRDLMCFGGASLAKRQRAVVSRCGNVFADGSAD